MDLAEKVEAQARSRLLVTHVRTQMQPGENWSRAFARIYSGRSMAEVALAEFAQRVGPSDRRTTIVFLLEELLRRHRREPETEAQARARLGAEEGPAGELYRQLQDLIANSIGAE